MQLYSGTRMSQNWEKEKLVAGLDEAGRGPVFGPMIMCGALFESGKLDELKMYGVRDSKLLSHSRRVMLSREIRRLAVRIEIIEIEPADIDRIREVEKINLNELEAMKFAEIIDSLSPEIAYVDAADPDPSMFESRISKYLTKSPRLVVENFADRKYVVVGAASIMAKVRREERIAELKRKYGDFGSGYPSDPRTVSFLRRWIEEHGDLPPFARRSWITAKSLLEK
jgi:ribonuclease HII